MGWDTILQNPQDSIKGVYEEIPNINLGTSAAIGAGVGGSGGLLLGKTLGGGRRTLGYGLLGSLGGGIIGASSENLDNAINTSEFTDQGANDLDYLDKIRSKFKSIRDKEAHSQNLRETYEYNDNILSRDNIKKLIKDKEEFLRRREQLQYLYGTDNFDKYKHTLNQTPDEFYKAHTGLKYRAADMDAGHREWFRDHYPKEFNEETLTRPYLKNIPKRKFNK